MKREKTILLLLLWIGVMQLSSAITVRFPNLTGVAGDTVTVPLYLDSDITASNVKSFQFQISYSVSALKFLGASTTGTLSEGFGALTVKDNTTYISIVGAGTTSLTGSGVLLNLKFVLINSGSYLQFKDGAISNYFNEGLPVLTYTYGYITIQAKPVIYFSPANAILLIGDTQQFSAYGGTAPYTLTVSDNSLASITADGKLTALKRGIVKISATDANGYTGVSGNIEIRSFSASIPDTMFYRNNYIDIPVILKNLDATNMLAGKFTFTYNQNVLSFQSLIVTNSLLDGTASVQQASQPGNLTVTFAGSAGITGSGVLFKMRFKIADVNGGATYISFGETLLNETLLTKNKNGYFTIQAFPTIYISPGSTEMYSGNTKQFTVSGGTAPYTWQVDDTSLATIDGSGLLSAVSGGNTKVWVKDVYGANTYCSLAIYDTWVDIRDSLADIHNKVLSLPIDLGPLPAGKSIYSLSGNVTFSSNKIDSIKISNQGMITNDWLLVNKSANAQSNFALSGSGKINNGGKLLNLTIYFNNTLTTGDYLYLYLNNFVLNEGSPNVKVTSGVVNIKSIYTDINPAHSKSGISIYPIPASDKLFVNLGSEYYKADVTVFDMNGKILQRFNKINSVDNQLTIPIESLLSGIYFLKVQGATDSAVLKFVKQ